MHLGHAYSALLAHDLARSAGGRFLLRIEDIDKGRSKQTWEDLIYDDLAWLGLDWETPVLRQSNRSDEYTSALENLWKRGVLYPCFCNRRDIQQAATAPQEGTPIVGADGIVYPGTCRALSKDPTGPMPQGIALRLDLNAAADQLSEVIHFEEMGDGAPFSGHMERSVKSLQHSVGDVVLSRKDMNTSYHLSVVLDDALQGITDVVRGADLYDATDIHVVLQKLLGLSTPRYHHHRLIRDDAGKRLAKRDDARALSKFRAEGVTPAGIREMVGLLI